MMMSLNAAGIPPNRPPGCYKVCCLVIVTHKFGMFTMEDAWIGLYKFRILGGEFLSGVHQGSQGWSKKSQE